MDDLQASAEEPLASIDVDSLGAAVRIGIAGEIDLSTADWIEHDTLAAREAAGSQELLLDLRDVTFMDSTGLRLLMNLLTHSRRHGYRLTVVRAAPPVHRAVVIAGLDSVLEFVDEPPLVKPSSAEH
jgi:anti-anti-sigma factor